MPSQFWTTAVNVTIGDRIQLTLNHNYRVAATVLAAMTINRHRVLVVKDDDGNERQISIPALSSLCTIHI
ncbi:MAG: hypothetical protein WC822_07115 [Candidatus Paceibacterota bacterium]|jgi:hypothetical protein